MNGDQDTYRRGYIAGLRDALRIVSDSLRGGADETDVARFCAERVAELDERAERDDVVALVKKHIPR